jgi:hypothetical protein
MKRNVLKPFLFVTLLVLAVSLACSINFGTNTEVPAPQPITQPTSVPIQPTITASPISTDTPAPSPTPTLSPMPTQSLSSIIEALKAAAQGSGVPEAAAYYQNKPGIHPIVIYTSSSNQDEWNASLPEAWLPVNVSQTELIAVIRYIDIVIEKSRYVGKGTGVFFVSRIRRDTEIILRETQTGKTVASTIFEGGEPPSLPKRLPLGTTALYGNSVAYGTVQSWLRSFVEQ